VWGEFPFPVRLKVVDRHPAAGKGLKVRLVGIAEADKFDKIVVRAN
jgi:GMP synthase PP-ATPase subunit